MDDMANTRRLIDEIRERAVKGWMRHPAVRVAVTSDFWIEGAVRALEDLDSGVGTLDQFDISWLVYHTLGARAWYPDDTSWPLPEWTTDPRVNVAGVKLMRVVTALGQLLEREGVPLDPEGIADRLVLAQLLTLEGLVDSPDAVEYLNLGSVGSVSEDGRSVQWDRHARDRGKKALMRLQERRLKKIRTPREGKYDKALRAVLTQRPTATPYAIARACWDGQDWAKPLWTEFSDDDVAVRTISHALKRIRGATKKQ